MGLMDCENKVLRKAFGSKMEELTENWSKLHNKKFIIFSPHQILFVWSDREKYESPDIRHLCG
jgi:DNA polymerase I-like protein with 3'-5' exonuclease and polymerase domains